MATERAGLPPVEFTNIAVAVGAGAAVLWAINRLTRSTFPYQEFIDLESTRSIADSLPTQEDEFILAAWKMVGGLPYEAIGSDLVFVNGTVQCRDCLLPGRTLARGRGGNCVAKSALLASILRHRLPPERVYIAVGFYVPHPSNPGGHAWVEVQRRGEWDILEATAPPDSANPWHTVDALRGYYQPGILYNDREKICYTDTYCVAIEAHGCPVCELARIR